MMEFHLSRLARERYHFDADLLIPEADFAAPDALAIQELVSRMNVRLGPLGQGVKPGHLYALVLLHQVFHRVVLLYRRQRETDLFVKAEAFLGDRLSGEAVAAMLRGFADHYPPLPVYRGERPLLGYFGDRHDDLAGRHVLIEQMLLVFLANINPAAPMTRDLYDDREFLARDDYLRHVWSLETFFAALAPFGPRNQSLFEMLTEPAKASPDSLRGQLEYVRVHWGDLLGEAFLRMLLRAEDIVREDEKLPWRPPGFGQGPDLEYLKALASKAMFAGAYAEPERFSLDADWMPRVVLLAKSVYVWLDQLAKRYQRSVRRLDEIPDEELDRLAHWGFTGLWLIGLWERSAASRTIKHLHGNIDAVASAYSIYDYRISGDLGGEAALDNLRERALRRGIRLASDLVPNHMGVDSKWVREHPDWFIQLDHPPYGVYRFSGPDLSGDPDIEIKIEDGYWTRSDAGVVFRRVDKRTGHTRFIYHGNDGTSMPWNDTAQLNFLLPEVREAVARLIVGVARRFPIIRFDAAMTLTRMHYQRLWFPEPGSGGAIPSRALHGLTQEEFDRQMPVEFWRQVVDRIAAEAPDTLLLAEAFWLLEGYFVRTLGMHRVYNSAFMNMLKLEENAKYRSVIKNVLEFDPRVLQRFVNFMNNPDEDTAVAQFGKGDKYFGVCVMMATMPGLPMFGHGQIEGLTERYGHEFQRAYYDEHADEDLIRRHEHEVFPLLRLRHLFSGAEHFTLYDVYRESGEVEENVFAYSNGYGEARALIVFHNQWAETSGWIHTSAAFSVTEGDGRKLVRRTLAEGLGLHGEPGLFYILKDRVAGLEYLRRGSDLVAHGMFVQLRAYQYQVFTEFREIRDDTEARWSRLCNLLGGRGVPSVEREFKRIYLAPLIEAFETFASAEAFCGLIEGPADSRETDGAALRAARFAARVRPFLKEAARFGGGEGDPDSIMVELATMAQAVISLASFEEHVSFDRSRDQRETRDHLIRALPERLSTRYSLWRVMCGWLAVWPVGRLRPDEGADARCAGRVEEWLLSEVLVSVFQQLGADENEAGREVAEVRSLLAHWRIAGSFGGGRRFAAVIQMLDDPAVQSVIGSHHYAGVTWFHRESVEEFLLRLFATTTVGLLADTALSPAERADRLAQTLPAFRQLEDLAALSEYQLDRFRTLLGYAARSPESPSPQPQTAGEGLRDKAS